MLEKNPFLVVNEKHFVLQCSRVEGSVFEYIEGTCRVSYMVTQAAGLSILLWTAGSDRTTLLSSCQAA